MGRLGRRGWIGVACLCLSILVALQLYSWYWPSREGWAARVATREKCLSAIQIPFDYSGNWGARIRKVRPLSPGSSKLLFWESQTNRVFELDTATSQLVQVSPSQWEDATGEVTDHSQIGPDAGDPPHNATFYARFGKDIKTAGNHVVSTVWSPDHSKIAVVTADGRFHPPRKGHFLFFFGGGGGMYADGQHYLEVRDSEKGSLLTPAVTVPRWRGELNVWWTADERFLICYYEYDEQLLLIPTGLRAASGLLSGQDAQRAGYAVFQPDRWWDRWVNAAILRIRYESPDSPVLLMSTGLDEAIYRYDPVDRSLTATDNAAWNSASGADYGPDEIFPKIRVKELSQDEQMKQSDAIIKRLNAGLPAKAPLEGIDGQIEHCRGHARSAGRHIQLYHPSPDKQRVLIISEDSWVSPNYYFQFFDPRSCDPLAEPIQIPKAVLQEADGPIWIPDGRYVLYENSDRRYLTVIHSDLVPP